MVQTTTDPARVTPGRPGGDGTPGRQVPLSQVLAWAVGTLALAVVVLYVAMVVGGADLASGSVALGDPGGVVRWGLPVVNVLTDLVALLTVGFLLVAAFLLPSYADGVRGLAVTAAGRASVLAVVWAVLVVVQLVLTVANEFGLPLSRLSWTLMTSYVGELGAGRGSLVQLALVLGVAVSARWVLRVQSLAVVLGLAVAALVPPALAGHSASAGAHGLAILSLLFHLVGAALWVGGLAGLCWVAARGSRRLEPAVRRFSALALWSLVVVAASGILNASVRVEHVDQLWTTGYGALLLVKTAAVVALAALGWAHRRRVLAGGRFAAATFVRLAAVEVLLMTLTVAVAVALSSSPPPVPDNLYTDPVESVLGMPLPPPPDLERFLTGFYPSGVGIAVVGLGTAGYLTGLAVMRRRGDRWPVGRTVAWFLGLAVVAYSTMGGLGWYGHVVFSIHMVSHMMLSMVAPIFLVLGAPVTLALRTLPGPREPGETSPRQLLLKVVHSRAASLLTHPVVAAAIFVGSLYGLYFSPLFGYLMDSHLGHVGMELHFLAVGSLFYYVLVGVDPSPRRIPALFRFGVLLVTTPFHAFFAIALMSDDTVIGGAYYRQLDRPYLSDLLADQRLAGGIAWGMGEVPLVLVMGAIFVQWWRSDRRDSARRDRQETDHELDSYNDYLASLSRSDR